MRNVQKVIGIFARLNHRDGKPKYLADVPRFFGYLDEALPKYPELAGLHGFIEQRVKPAMAQRAAGARRRRKDASGMIDSQVTRLPPALP